HNRDQRVDAVGQDVRHHLTDVGVPVAHADVGAERQAGRLGRCVVQLPLDTGCLGLGQLHDLRAPADSAVALGQLGQQLVRVGSPAAHVQEVGGDVLE